ncbi:MAG TPA: hypothetical protein VFP23_03420 [Solirubrobacterales bacterium]|nr:hypothetical protein [Solirubrobacterales bacterium]
MTMPEPGVSAASQALIEELMGAVVAVDFVLRVLMGLPADVLPGEDRSEAIRAFLTTSACREVNAVGQDACRAATELIETVIGRIADDAQAIAQLAGEIGPC